MTRRRKSVKRHFTLQAGFTLLEVMVAVGILSTITVLLWGSFKNTFRTKSVVESKMSRFRVARLAMDRILRDVQMAYLSSNNVLGTEPTPRTFFDGVRRTDIDELRFSYFGHQRLYADAKEADTAVVGYYGMRDPADSRKLNLYRREARRLQADRFENVAAEAELLADDVVRLELSYYHPDRKEWLETWRTSQADGMPGRLPSRVQVKLTVYDDSGEELLLISEARVAMHELLNTKPEPPIM